MTYTLDLLQISTIHSASPGRCPWNTTPVNNPCRDLHHSKVTHTLGRGEYNHTHQEDCPTVQCNCRPRTDGTQASSWILPKLVVALDKPCNSTGMKPCLCTHKKSGSLQLTRLNANSAQLSHNSKAHQCQKILLSTCFWQTEGSCYKAPRTSFSDSHYFHDQEILLTFLIHRNKQKDKMRDRGIYLKVKNTTKPP